MQGCTVCNSELPRENVVEQMLNGDSRVVYVHCEFCNRIIVSLDDRDGHEWKIRLMADLTKRDNPTAYRREVSNMCKAQNADAPQEIAA